MADAVSLSFPCEPIGDISLDQAGKLVFPQTPTAPGVYRFEIDGDVDWVYFGEAAELATGISPVPQSGPNATHQPANGASCPRGHPNGGRGQDSLAQLVSFEASEPSCQLDLRLKAARVLIEGSAIVLARARDDQLVLNLDRSFDRSLRQR